MRGKGKHITKEEYEKIKLLVEHKLPLKAISELTARSESTICRIKGTSSYEDYLELRAREAERHHANKETTQENVEQDNFLSGVSKGENITYLAQGIDCISNQLSEFAGIHLAQTELLEKIANKLDAICNALGV